MISTNLMYAEKISVDKPVKQKDLDSYYRHITIVLNTGQEVSFCVFARAPEALEVHDATRDACVVCKCTLMLPDGPPHCLDCHPDENEDYESS